MDGYKALIQSSLCSRASLPRLITAVRETLFQQPIDNYQLVRSSFYRIKKKENSYSVHFKLCHLRMLSWHVVL